MLLGARMFVVTSRAWDSAAGSYLEHGAIAQAGTLDLFRGVIAGIVRATGPVFAR